MVVSHSILRLLLKSNSLYRLPSLHHSVYSHRGRERYGPDDVVMTEIAYKEEELL